MSISSELLTLNNTKTAIKTAINNKGGNITNSTPFADYATAITNLPSGGGSGTPLIESIDVSDFSGTTFNDFRTYITDVTIPSGVTSIGENAFSGCTGLTSITIPSGVTTIGNYAFYACTGLTSITIPSGVTTIGNNALSYCSGLTGNITIPSGVTSIGSQAFYGDSQLTYFLVNATTPPTLVHYNAFNNTNNCPIYVPSASVAAYKAATNWSSLASRIYGLVDIATVDNTTVTNADLGNTDGTILTDTQMLKLPSGTSISFAEGVTTTQGEITGYTSVTLPSTFTNIGYQYGIGSSVTTLTCWATTPPSAERGHLGGSNLAHIYVPASVVNTYKADSTWSSFASIIEALPSITITEYEDQSVVDNAIDLGEFFGYDGDEVVVDQFNAASANSTFDSDLKAANIIVVEDDNGNDITSQCTFTSPDFSRWDSTQDPSWDGESPATYEWQAGDTIASGDSQTPGSVSITATYGRFTDTLILEYSKTEETPEPEPEPDPEEPEEE